MTEENENISDDYELDASTPWSWTLCAQLPLDLAFSPKAHQLAVAHIDGSVSLYAFDLDTRQLQLQQTCQPHTLDKSCRGVTFTPSGDGLISAGVDCRLVHTDLQTGKAIWSMDKAHEHGINRLIRLDQEGMAPLWATGDDEGIVQIWDIRKPSRSVHQFEEHSDYIADIMHVPRQRTLLAAGGDGFLSVMDLRNRSLIARSDPMEAELLSLATARNNTKVLCGMSDGVIGLFNWGDWGDMRDRFPGHPLPVDALQTVSLPSSFQEDAKGGEEWVCSACSDGLIRVISILPNSFVGLLGDHGGLPIERLAVPSSEAAPPLLGSIGHDYRLKLWSLEEDSSDNEETEEQGTIQKNSLTKRSLHSNDDLSETESGKNTKKRKDKKGGKGKKHQPASSVQSKEQDFFQDLLSESESSD